MSLTTIENGKVQIVRDPLVTRACPAVIDRDLGTNKRRNRGCLQLARYFALKPQQSTKALCSVAFICVLSTIVWADVGLGTAVVVVKSHSIRVHI